jgi:PPOX class probable F420-dependent enzyme
MIDDSTAQFLLTHRQAVLATIRRDGRPQLSNVLAVYIDGALHLSLTETRAKYKNLRRDPRCTLLVQGDNFWQYTVVSGTASFVHLPEALPGLRRYYETASGPHPNWEEYDQAMQNDRRVLCIVSIDSVVRFPAPGQ